MKINKNYLNLKPSYLFKNIAEKTAQYKEAHPDADIIKMGIGDVTLPICKAAADAMTDAAKEMGNIDTFHGYPSSYGEDFLLSAISNHYKKHIGIDIDENEIIVTCGAKEDVANILDIFDTDTTVLIPDPVYPVYLDTNIMTGRKIKFINATEENAYLPLPTDADAADLIYICSPNNPTGAAYTREQLKVWVDFAIKNNAVILYDAAYEMFISDSECPRSIFEIDGARQCAIELCSFSKTAGFTGVRCGYTVIPTELESDGVKLLDVWKRRQSTKFNGVSYPVQRAAQAAYSPQGMAACYENIAYYRKNAAMLASVLDEKGIYYTGGKNSPYLWLQCPGGMASWDFFDYLLEKANLVGTPGEGFGKCGEGFFRLTSFSSHELTEQAVRRLREVL